MRQARLAGRARLHLIETAEFWRDAPEIERGEVRAGRHRDRGLLLPRRRAHREGRQLHQHAAAAAVASQSDRAAGRLPQRAALHLSPRPAAEAALRRHSTDPKDRPIQRPDLGLSERRARISEPDAEAVLREINGYDGRDRQAGRRIHATEGRRLAPPAAAGSTPAATRTA